MKKPYLKLPPLSTLLKEFDYNPLTGILIRKSTGNEVGSSKEKYKTVRIHGKTYKVHRIVFYMYHKRDPKHKVIDHINGDAHDNSICNLRACKYRDNNCNTPKQRALGKEPKPESGAGRFWFEPIRRINEARLSRAPKNSVH